MLVQKERGLLLLVQEQLVLWCWTSTYVSALFKLKEVQVNVTGMAVPDQVDRIVMPS